MIFEAVGPTEVSKGVPALVSNSGGRSGKMRTRDWPMDSALRPSRAASVEGGEAMFWCKWVCEGGNRWDCESDSLTWLREEGFRVFILVFVCRTMGITACIYLMGMIQWNVQNPIGRTGGDGWSQVPKKEESIGW